MISQLLQMCKKRARPLVRRRSVRHQRIINIKNNASISILIKAVKIDLIGRIYVFSRVKPFQHCPFAPLLISLSAHPYIDYYISTKISTRNFQFALFVFLRALFTSPRGAHPRRAFLCNRNKVSYYTKRLHTHVYTVPSAHDSIV